MEGCQEQEGGRVLHSGHDRQPDRRVEVYYNLFTVAAACVSHSARVPSCGSTLVLKAANVKLYIPGQIMYSQVRRKEVALLPDHDLRLQCSTYPSYIQLTEGWSFKSFSLLKTISSAALKIHQRAGVNEGEKAWDTIVR